MIAKYAKKTPEPVDPNKELALVNERATAFADIVTRLVAVEAISKEDVAGDTNYEAEYEALARRAARALGSAPTRVIRREARRQARDSSRGWDYDKFKALLSILPEGGDARVVGDGILLTARGSAVGVGGGEKLIHNGDAFKVGDIVKIFRKVKKAEGWYSDWAEPYMTSRVGQQGRVLSTGPRGIQVRISNKTEDFDYRYPSCALRKVKAKVAVIEAGNHDPKAFSVGDRVRLVGKAFGGRRGWDARWVPEMTRLIGRVGTVRKSEGTSGFRVKIGTTSFLYPSFVLRKLGSKGR